MGLPFIRRRLSRSERNCHGLRCIRKCRHDCDFAQRTKACTRDERRPPQRARHSSNRARPLFCRGEGRCSWAPRSGCCALWCGRFLVLRIGECFVASARSEKIAVRCGGGDGGSISCQLDSLAFLCESCLRLCAACMHSFDMPSFGVACHRADFRQGAGALIE